jgi:pimeloyl-ACP methyl ester carboxylesterase
MNRYGSALKTTVAGITVAWLSPFLGYLYGQTKTENRPASTVGIEPLKKLSEVVPPERLIKADGFQTYFVQNGQNGPEILLLHGFGSSTFTWRKNLEALGKIGRVTAIDIKGFGLTEKPKDGQYGEAAYVRQVLAVMDALGIKKPLIIGNSMGGAVAARVALENPGRCSGLILVDAARPYTRLDFAASGVDTTKFKGRPSVLATALVRTMIRRDRIKGFLDSVYEGHEPVTDAMIDAYYVPTTIEGAPEALLSMMNPPPDSAKPIPLANLKCPVTVLWGKQDNVIPVRAGESLAHDIPNSELVIWASAGHLPHEDKPEEFHALVQQFVLKHFKNSTQND